MIAMKMVMATIMDVIVRVAIADFNFYTTNVDLIGMKRTYFYIKS